LSHESFIAAVALIGIVIIISSLLSGAVERTGLPQVAIFLLVGVVLGPAGLDLIRFTLESPALQVIATLGLVLVLFSDGVTEEVDPNDQQFGEERLANMVAELSSRPAAEIVQEVHRAVHAFTQGAAAADDITVVIARRL